VKEKVVGEREILVFNKFIEDMDPTMDIPFLRGCLLGTVQENNECIR